MEQERYMRAVMNFTEKAKKDVNVIAVVLFGSLSYDTVWEKSDIDLKVIIRDQKIETRSYCIDEDDIVINAEISTRSSFVQTINKALGGLWNHSYLSKGKVLYTSDESINEYFDELKTLGAGDMAVSALSLSAMLIGTMQKVEKWIKVKNDATYARYYAIRMADDISRLEVCFHNEPPTRETLLRASEINPDLMERFYKYPMNNVLSCDDVMTLVKEADEYLMSKIDVISKPVIQFLSDGEPKTVTMFTNYFRNMDSHFIIEILEYLREKGVIEKANQTIRITPKGRAVVEEFGYIYVY